MKGKKTGGVVPGTAFEYRCENGDIIYRDFIMPDPLDNSTFDALAAAQEGLYPDLEMEDVPKKITLSRRHVVRLQALARAYVHLTSTDLLTPEAIAKLRWVRFTGRKHKQAAVNTVKGT